MKPEPMDFLYTADVRPLGWKLNHLSKVTSGVQKLTQVSTYHEPGYASGQ